MGFHHRVKGRQPDIRPHLIIKAFKNVVGGAVHQVLVFAIVPVVPINHQVRCAYGAAMVIISLKISHIDVSSAGRIADNLPYDAAHIPAFIKRRVDRDKGRFAAAAASSPEILQIIHKRIDIHFRCAALQRFQAFLYGLQPPGTIIVQVGPVWHGQYSNSNSRRKRLLDSGYGAPL